MFNVRLADRRKHRLRRRPWWDHGGMSNPYWPLFGLRVRTPRLELRYPDDDDLVAIAALAAEGIHDPETMPFNVPWTRAHSPELERGVVQFLWARRGELSPEKWGLPFLVRERGRPVGVQEVFAENFSVTRAVESGSWLVRHAHGHGIGTEMRAAILHLAFEGLGAVEAYSGSFEDNLASEAVSRANGYEPNGSALREREGKPARLMKWVITRERWLERRRADITIEGLDPCRELLGAVVT
jgi:RimJ/RimL family protein N-acetyltransferase